MKAIINRINKEHTIVEDNYIWMSVNCEDMAPRFDINGLSAKCVKND